MNHTTLLSQVYYAARFTSVPESRTNACNWGTVDTSAFAAALRGRCFANLLQLLLLLLVLALLFTLLVALPLVPLIGGVAGLEGGALGDGAVVLHAILAGSSEAEGAFMSAASGQSASHGHSSHSSCESRRFFSAA